MKYDITISLKISRNKTFGSFYLQNALYNQLLTFMKTSIEKKKSQSKEDKKAEKKVGLFKKIKQRISNVTKTPKKWKKPSNDLQSKTVSQYCSLNNISSNKNMIPSV